MSRRGGFTLVELLVVVTILVVLSTMIVWAVASTRGTDRLRSAARTAQSAFLGARDRAVHAKERRGIRFVRDPSDGHIVSGFMWVRPLPPQSLQRLQVERTNNGAGDSLWVFDSQGSAQWVDWWQQGILSTQSRIRIPAVTGTWYKLASADTAAAAGLGQRPRLTLQSPVIDYDASNPPPAQIAILPASTLSTGDLDIGNEAIPLTEPVALAFGCVIDLRWSSVPGVSQADLVNPLVQIDLLFSPRGGLTGPIVAGGPLHFLLTDLQDAVSVDPNDATKPLSPIHPRNRGEKLIIAVFPQTGLVQTFPIDPTDADSNGQADDLYRFARLGQGAN